MNMRHGKVITKCLFGLLAVGLVVVLAILLAKQPAATRLARLNITVKEIQRGNYFAWVQATSRD